jgi:hypothetical protein
VSVRGSLALVLAGVSALGLSACAKRTVTITSEPPGALVGLWPDPKMSTITPGSITGLRAGRSYTVRARLPGWDPTYAAIEAETGFPWPWPINYIIQLSGGYDSAIHIKMLPCTAKDACNEDEELNRLLRRLQQVR